MDDLFEHSVVCKKCKKETAKTKTVKEGFELRAWECHKCHTLIYHPGDVRDFEEYKKLRKQHFNVKLRMVGNSFCVSIPREIIDFHQEMEQMARMQRRMHQLVRLSLEGPGKVGLFFFEKKRFPAEEVEGYVNDEDEEESEEETRYR